MFGIDIKFKVDGREIPVENVQDELMKQVFLLVRKNICEALQSVRCPVHGQAPTVTVEGSSLDDLIFQISGCCEKLIEETKEKLRFST